MVDRVFQDMTDEGDADAASRTSPRGLVLHAASAIDVTTVAQVLVDLRRGIQRDFGGRGLLEVLTPKRCSATSTAGFR